MPRLHDHLQSFYSDHVEPTADQKSQADDSQAHLRELVEAKHESDALFPRLIEGEFLAGSFARNTKPKPLDDVDLYLVLDGVGLTAYDRGMFLGSVVRGSNASWNPILDNHYNGPDGMKSSIVVLNAFRDALRESYPKSDIRRDGQAVNVWLDSYGLGIDVVPAFHIIPAGSGERYFIPAGNGLHGWLATNPKVDTEAMDLHDAIHGGQLRPIIKLVKHWSKNVGRTGLKSYHLEVMVREAMTQNTTGASIERLQTAFQLVSPRVLAACPDPAGFGDPLDKYLDPAQRNAIASRFTEASIAVATARILETRESIAAAVGALQTVFGDRLGN